MSLNKKQRTTYLKIWADPKLATIKQADVLRLLDALGCEPIHTSKTSANVAYSYNGYEWGMHRVHPSENEGCLKKPYINKIRKFFDESGITEELGQ